MGCGSSAPVAGDLESLSGSQRAAALARPHTTLTPQASRKDGLLLTPSAAQAAAVAAALAAASSGSAAASPPRAGARAAAGPLSYSPTTGAVVGDAGGAVAHASAEAHGIPSFPAGLQHRLQPTLRPLAERYELDRKVLGAGGFGEVRGCTRRSDGRRMAVKTISKLKFAGEHERTLMVDEVQLMHRVRGHVNVVELAEWCEDQANFYMVVEICGGGELMERIVQQDHFSERVASRLFRQMAAGVQWCHSRLVCHRDIKPENFLFEGRGDGALLKLTDFGLACALASPDSTIDDACGEYCGSAYYIAPEVFRGPYTKEADIFSLGVNLFLMLSGTVPFGARAKSEEAIYAALQTETLHFEGVWERSTPAVRELLTGLLDKDPAKRYTLAQVLAHPWVAGDAATDERIDRSILSSLLSFTAKNKFKKEALRLAATAMTAQDVAKLRTAFMRIDADNSGFITFAELSQEVGKLEVADAARISSAMREMDADGDGKVSYDEFITAVVDRQLVHHQNMIWFAFCEYDLDGDGKITRDELSRALAMHGEPPEKVAAYISEFDSNGDGHIDYEEFMRMLLPKDVKFRVKHELNEVVSVSRAKADAEAAAARLAEVDSAATRLAAAAAEAEEAVVEAAVAAGVAPEEL